MINAPFKISDRCCDILKKEPLDRYAKETGSAPLTGMVASESHNRIRQYIKQGCSPFYADKPISWPIAFWTDKDIWDYIKKYDVPYSSIYDTGINRTGCMFCMFGVHLETGKNRFQQMAKTHPAQYRYCMDKLKLSEVLDYMGIEY